MDFGAAILKFCVASVIFEKSGVWRVYVPNFMLVSQSERFGLYYAFVCSTNVRNLKQIVVKSSKYVTETVEYC